MNQLLEPMPPTNRQRIALCIRNDAAVQLVVELTVTEYFAHHYCCLQLSTLTAVFIYIPCSPHFRDFCRAIARLSYTGGVSVCPSHAGTTSKLMHIGLCGFSPTPRDT